MLICDFTQFYSPVSGGVRRYLMEKRRWIERQGGRWRHLLIVPGEINAHTREGQHTECITLQAPRIDPTSRYRVLINIPALRSALRSYRPQVIECGDPYHATWAVLEEARDLRSGCIGFYHSHFPDAYLRTANKYIGAWAHGFILDYARHYIQRLYSQFDMTLVPSPHLCEVLASWGVPRVHHLMLGVDTSTFNYAVADSALRESLAPDNVCLLLYVGRLSGEKNIVTLLRAFDLLQKISPQKYHLHLVGDGPLRSLLRASMRRHGKSMSWRRFITDSYELAAHYRAADLLVHPGVCETFGLVSVEAQTCGLPVCGIRGSFMDPIILSGLDLWAEANTPEALCQAIQRMNEHRHKISRSELAAVAAAQFSWDVVFPRLFKFYSEVKP